MEPTQARLQEEAPSDAKERFYADVRRIASTTHRRVEESRQLWRSLAN